LKSIRRRLAFSLALALVIVLGGGAVAVYRPIEKALRGEFDASLEAKLLAVVEFAGGNDNPDSKLPVAAGLEKLFEGAFAKQVNEGTADLLFELWNSSGGVAWRSKQLGGHDLTAPRHDHAGTDHYSIELPDGTPARATSYRSGETAFPLVVLARDYTPVLQKLTALRWLLVVVAAASLAAALALGHLALARGLAPLEELGQAMAQRGGAETTEPRLPPDLPAELKPFVARVDELVRRLDLALARERRFNAAIAHELRTPVAELRATTEIALSGAPEDAVGAIHDVDQVGRRLESLVVALLAMRRGEFQQGTLGIETVDLADVVNAAAKRAAPAATARGLGLETRADCSGPIDTQPSLLRAILDHLLDNAIEYAPAATTIELDARVEKGGFVVRVRNERPPELAPDEVERLFEPFTRREPRPPRDRHTGFGLMTTKAFVQQLGGVITSRLHDGQVEIELRGAARAPVPV
jgi:two-component system sensor histidine kinase QseC